MCVALHVTQRKRSALAHARWTAPSFRCASAHRLPAARRTCGPDVTAARWSTSSTPAQRAQVPASPLRLSHVTCDAVARLLQREKMTSESYLRKWLNDFSREKKKFELRPFLYLDECGLLLSVVFRPNNARKALWGQYFAIYSIAPQKSRTHASRYAWKTGKCITHKEIHSDDFLSENNSWLVRLCFSGVVSFTRRAGQLIHISFVDCYRLLPARWVQ